jgi:hypothetical protein
MDLHARFYCLVVAGLHFIRYSKGVIASYYRKIQVKKMLPNKCIIEKQ